MDSMDQFDERSWRRVERNRRDILHAAPAPDDADVSAVLKMAFWLLDGAAWAIEVVAIALLVAGVLLIVL